MTKENKGSPPSSLAAKVEQVAKFLREGVRTSESTRKRSVQVHSESTSSLTLTNTIEQIAKMLRSETHSRLKSSSRKK